MIVLTLEIAIGILKWFTVCKLLDKYEEANGLPMDYGRFSLVVIYCLIVSLVATAFAGDVLLTYLLVTQ